MTIPIGVDNMVFYSKATGATTVTPATKRSEGVTVFPNFNSLTPANDPAGIKFSLEKIHSSDFAAPENTTTGILSKLNAVVKTTNWKEAATDAVVKVDPNYKVLVDLYNALITMRTVDKDMTDPTQGTLDEIRQGSGFAVLTVVKYLYDAVTNFKSNASDAVPAGAPSGMTSPLAIATAIETAITSNFTVTPATTSAPTTVSFTTAAWNTYPQLASGGAMLPMGAAQITFNAANNAFEWVNPNALRADAINVDNFMYPAELCYWVSSPIRVSDDANIKNSDYPTTVSAWESETNWTKWVKKSTVTATTRAVALQNNIQYANAMLQSTVEYSATSLSDNTKQILDPTSANSDITNQTIAVNDDSFKVMGVLVGGQPESVNWNWISAPGAYVVYDVATAAQQQIQKSSASSPIYTLLFDNYKTGTTQEDVTVAIELLNNTGKDFYGKNNLIPAGATFYLVGQLKIADAGTSAVAAVKAACPTNVTNDDFRAPYLLNDDSFVFRIFMQDFKTIAKFKIGANSLQHAYSTVPDLRSTQMTFGLSVDLVWKQGVTFNVNLGE